MNNKISKIVVLTIAVVAFAISVIGCGSGGNDSNAGQNVQAVKPPNVKKAGGKHDPTEFTSIQ